MPKGLVDIKGFDKFLEKVKHLPDKTKRVEIQKIFTRVALPLKQNIKSKVAPSQRTGRLYRSIGHKRGTQAPVLAVGFVKLRKAPHAHLYESGTSNRGRSGRMPAFEPVEKAFKEKKSSLITDSGKSVAKYIQKTIDRLRSKKTN